MVKIAILGCGTIGQGVYDIITDRMNDGVLSVERVLDLRDLTGYIADGIQTRDFADIENDPGISVVVETMGGVKPAYDFVKASLIAGKHVVTSNKALVDACGTELLKIAAEHGVHFFFEASVGGGIPVIRALTDSLGGDKVLKIEGILNGTTNYILTAMEKDGTGMEEVLKKAQELGYAERDPSADIEGYDTARKIAILASIMTGRKVSYEDVPTQGITGISLEDIKKAASCGRRIKLIGRAELKEDGSLNISVSPEEVGEDSMFFGVDGAYNAVITESRDTGKLMFFGSGAGRYPTAAAIIADILHTQDPVSGKLLWE